MTEPNAAAETGLVASGQGGPGEELLQDGQEEVFSRAEVERGVVEHHTGEKSDIAETPAPKPPPADHSKSRG